MAQNEDLGQFSSVLSRAAAFFGQLNKLGVSLKKIEHPITDRVARRRLAEFLEADCPDFTVRRKQKFLKTMPLDALPSLHVYGCFRGESFEVDCISRDSKKLNDLWPEVLPPTAPTTVGVYRVVDDTWEDTQSIVPILRAILGFQSDMPFDRLVSMIKALKLSLTVPQYNHVLMQQERFWNGQKGGRDFKLEAGTAVAALVEKSDGTLGVIEGTNERVHFEDLDAKEEDDATYANGFIILNHTVLGS